MLNMDHYCPWMFNVVGYRNYHYFWRTLLFTSLFAVRLTAHTFTVLARCVAARRMPGAVLCSAPSE